MAQNETIAANTTELYKARQTSPKVFPTPAGMLWKEQEPNSYSDFGRQDKKTARTPINSGRMKKKAVIVGYEATAGYEVDVTSGNMLEIAEDFLFAAVRRKGFLVAAAIVADGYTATGGVGGLPFRAGDLIYVEGASSAQSNLGLKLLATNATAGKITLAGLTADATAKVEVFKVGHQFAAGDASIDVIDGLPNLVSVAYDMRELGLLPGEQVYLGADADGNRFANPKNVGWLRVKSVSEDAVVFDRSDAVFEDDAGAGKTIRIYFGDVVKNEAELALQRTFYNAFRRRVGIAAEASNVVQSEVVWGGIANELEFTIPEQDKLVASVGYMARNYKAFSDDDDVDENGTFEGVKEEDAINSSNDAKRIRFWGYPKGAEQTSSPLALIGAFTEFSITINNNVATNNAVGSAGAYAHTPGFFDVMVSGTGYFVNIGSLQSIRDNVDIGFSFITAKDNRGIAWDVPLLSASTDGLSIEINAPITLDIDSEASSGKKYDAGMNHALLMNFYSYLPDVACED